MLREKMSGKNPTKLFLWCLHIIRTFMYWKRSKMNFDIKLVHDENRSGCNCVLLDQHRLSLKIPISIWKRQKSIKRKENVWKVFIASILSDLVDDDEHWLGTHDRCQLARTFCAYLSNWRFSNQKLIKYLRLGNLSRLENWRK